MSVMGLKNIVVKLEKHKKATVKGLRAGLYRGGLFVQREAQKIVPIDKDILRPSITTEMEGEGFDSSVNVGTSTAYAIYVHENLEAKHKPGKSAKYLEKPFREGRDDIAEIVVDAIREFQE